MGVEQMDSMIIDGKGTALAVRRDVALRVDELKALGVEPSLAVVLVGDDPASQVYVRNKDRAATKAGFLVQTLRLPASTPQAELMSLVEGLNGDPAVHGILVQLPLPKGIDADLVVRALDPAKDVDGLHPDNVAALWRSEPGLVPCTPAGCIELLDRYDVPIEGAQALVIGRSQLVGKPMAALLLARNATVTIGHSRTRDLPGLCRQADIVVAAVGRREMLRGDWIKPGAVVLDVGMNQRDDGSLCGDVLFEEVSRVASKISPVPKGVGPMTIAMLLSNTAKAATQIAGLQWKGMSATIER